MTFSAFSDRLFLVSERNKMNNKMKNKETFKCFNCEKSHPIEVKKDWGFDQVCPECDLYLFDEAEKRDKRRVQNALFCSKYGVWA